MHTEIAPGVLQIDTLLGGWHQVTAGYLVTGDAPVLVKYSIPEFRALLAPFGDVRIVPERFPVKSRLHKGWKAVAFNTVFVGAFNALPRALVRRYGWHLMAFCRK